VEGKKRRFDVGRTGALARTGEAPVLPERCAQKLRRAAWFCAVDAHVPMRLFEKRPVFPLAWFLIVSESRHAKMIAVEIN
jgi:hypothetical protein